MKNQIIRFVALCVIACGIFVKAGAQVPSVPDAVNPVLSTGAAAVKTNASQGVEARLNKLKTSLNLTDDQIAKVQPLLAAEFAARKSGDKQAVKDSHQKMASEMTKILTPVQLTKYKEMMNPAKPTVVPDK